MRFSLDQILAFVATVEAGSFSEAARRLEKAQSAVSTAVMNLELDMGITLFNREGRYPLLTEEGRIVYREAKGILARCEDLECRADSMSEGVESHIKLAIDELVPSNFNTEILTRFTEIFPSVDLEMVLATGNIVPELMSSRKATLGITVVMGKMPQGIQYKLIANLKRIAVASKNHPLAKKKKVTKSDLEEHRQLVVYDRKGNPVYEGSRFSKDCWKIDSYYVIWDLVRKSVGWAWLADYLVAGDLKKGTLVSLPVDFLEADFYVPLYLVWHEEYSLGPAGRWLLNELSALGKKEDWASTFEEPWG